MQELVYYGQALSKYQKHIVGNIGIVTGSGGHGTLAVDMARELGMNVPALDSLQQETIRATLSPSVQPIAICANPVDVTGSAVDMDFVGAARSMMMMDNIDCVVMLALPYMPGVSIDLGGMLGIMRRNFNKPLIAYVPRLEKYGSTVEGFELNGVPVAHSVEGALKMAQGLVKNKVIIEERGLMF
jgi:acyl-CoA synthetase (NDP forming)